MSSKESRDGDGLLDSTVILKEYQSKTIIRLIVQTDAVSFHINPLVQQTADSQAGMMLDFPKKRNTSGGVCIFKTIDGLHLYASACVEIPFLTTEHLDLIDLHECTSFTKPDFPSPKQNHSNMTVGKYIQSKKLLAAICQLVEASNKYYFVERSSAGGSSQWGHIIFKKKKLCQQMLALRHR